MGCLARSTYQAILADVDLPVLCCLHLGLLGLKYPGVPQDTICAIFAQENQYKVLKSHHIHKANMDSYCRRYLDGEDLLMLCAEVDFPPCLMVRRMLEGMMGLSKQRVSDVLKQPALLQGVDAAAALQLWQQRATATQPQQHHNHQQHHHNHHHQQQQVVPHRQHPGSSSSSRSRWEPQRLLQCLQRDVVRCVHADRSYSPYCDMAKSLAGLEHEAFLYQQLQAAGVPFWSEQELRDKGLFKTPDALLQVPICIKGAGGQWHMVHWLDSKASFGDDRTHTQQMEGQYATYVNRYGPGCVIYWFGFIDGLSVSVQHASAAVGVGGGGTGSGGGSSGGRSSGAVGGESVEQQQLGLQHQQQVDVVLRDIFPAADEIMQLPQHHGHMLLGGGAAAPAPVQAGTAVVAATV